MLRSILSSIASFTVGISTWHGEPNLRRQLRGWCLHGFANWFVRRTFRTTGIQARNGISILLRSEEIIFICRVKSWSHRVFCWKLFLDNTTHGTIMQNFILTDIIAYRILCNGRYAQWFCHQSKEMNTLVWSITISGYDRWALRWSEDSELICGSSATENSKLSRNPAHSSVGTENVSPLLPMCIGGSKS